jgi:hypothetical protein
MFSSLGRADIVVKPGPDGRHKYVQTDQRTAKEIEQKPELSVLFALTRILNPKRSAKAGSPEPVVLYVARERPPEFLQRVIAAAGGRLVVGKDQQPVPYEGEPPRLEEVVRTAFANLARAVAAEHAVALTPGGLEKLERTLAETAGDAESDELAYWSAVMKLGSFGGEMIRASNGGQWLVIDSGTLPFALSSRFQGEQATVNPLGKAIKRFTNGEEDSLVGLVEMLRSQP